LQDSPGAPEATGCIEGAQVWPGLTTQRLAIPHGFIHPRLALVNRPQTCCGSHAELRAYGLGWVFKLTASTFHDELLPKQTRVRERGGGSKGLSRAC